MRTYEACLEELHSRPRYSRKKDLSRIQALLGRLGNPQERLHFVHVAGTNGKGSVCALTAAALQASGARVGLFTSPYLKAFEERIRVNGESIPREAFCRLYEQVLAQQQRLECEGGEPCNEFEFTTALGLLWFVEFQCDWVVLEVGLGGRLDATNVISVPACCCITTIGVDHTAQLGSTIAEIAAEKAGIIKPGCTVVTPHDQAPEALAVFERVCEQRGAKLLRTAVPEVLQLRPEGTTFRYGELEVCIPLAGAHQAGNCACALEICRVLQIPDRVSLEGMRRTAWPGRLQLLSRQPLVVLDAAHNPNGIAVLQQAMDTIYQDRRVIALMAMMRDKDYPSCVRAIAGRAERFYATQLDMPRALAAEELAELAKTDCSASKATVPIRAALEEALSQVPVDGMLLICGSVYLAGEILRILDSTPLFDKK